MVAVTAEASDDSAVERVDLYVDGIQKSPAANGVKTAAVANSRSRGVYTFVWDARSASFGAHRIRAVAWDDGGLSAADEIAVNVSNVRVGLTSKRASDKAWIIERDFCQIVFSVENANTAPIAKYAIMRRSGGEAYRVLKELLPSELQNSGFSYQDKFLDKDKTYTYKVVAMVADGSTIASSKETTI